jgi:hypothetical protein
MSITLQLPPEIEARLRASAARRGQSVEEYLIWLAARDNPAASSSPPPDPPPGADRGAWSEVLHRFETGRQPTQEEQEQAFQALAGGIHTGVALSGEELRRENLYEDGQ